MSVYRKARDRRANLLTSPVPSPHPHLTVQNQHHTVRPGSPYPPTELKAFCHLLAPIALRPSAFLFPLLALRNKMHFIAVDLRNALRNDPFIKPAYQLVYRLTFTSFYFHYYQELSNRDLPRSLTAHSPPL